MEEKIFSILLTENELKMFSKWIEEFNKEDQEYLDELNFKPGTGYETLVHSKRSKDGSLSRMQAARGYLNAKRSNDNIKSRFIPKDDANVENYYRMSKKAGIGILDEEELDNIAEKYGYKSDQFKDALNKQTQKLTQSSSAIVNENRLRKSGYDDKYSSKVLERVLDRKIDSDDASAIAHHRSAANNTYEKDSGGNIIRGNVLEELKRHYKDSDIVYGEAFNGRSLGKDAAIAAAVVGSGVALRKHIKKKKQEKELAESKYNRSRDKKDKK